MQEVTLSVQLCTTDRAHSRGTRPALVTTGQRPGPEAAPAAHLSTYHRPVPGGIPETISSSVYKCETAAFRRPSPNKALLSYFLTWSLSEID
eukprot:SAG31_NODE_621_length_13502_cov_18.057002_10_plen_92_part_00